MESVCVLARELEWPGLQALCTLLINTQITLYSNGADGSMPPHGSNQTLSRNLERGNSSPAIYVQTFKFIYEFNMQR